MVTASMYIKYLKEQEIKDKRRLEKEAAEKKRKEEIEKYAQKRKLERELAEGLEIKLDRLERKLTKRPEIKLDRLERKLTKGSEIKLDRLERLRRESELRRELRLKKKEEREQKKEPYIKPKKKEEFLFTEEEKTKCREKTLDQLVDEISGSQLVCPPGKELKKDIDQRELTVDLVCFRKRVIRKSPEEIVALYDRLLADDPERLCKEKKE